MCETVASCNERSNGLKEYNQTAKLHITLTLMVRDQRKYFKVKKQQLPLVVLT